MKKKLISTLFTVLLFSSAFAYTHIDNNGDGNDESTEVVESRKSDDGLKGLELLTYKSSNFCLDLDTQILAVSTPIPYRSAVSGEEVTQDCKQCRSGELCVKGRCMSLQRIERESGERFDSACARTRCEEGEACVAGNCFQLASHERMESGSCTGVDCKEGQACYRGVCYDAVDENNNPVQCFSGDVEGTPDYTPPRCDDGNSCVSGRCLDSKLAGSGVNRVPVNILACGSGMIRMSGTCVSITRGNCSNCKNGEICLGGSCYGLIEKLGEPCRQNRCKDGATCVSGICVNL